MFLRQSTASQEILLGPFVDSTDGNTAETGLTIANTDIDLFKAGATTLADKNSGGATHIAGGYYSAVLDATDTNTVGELEVHVKVSGALAVMRRYYVLEEAVYDAIFGASAALAMGSVTGAVGSVTGAVGSVTGNVGGNVNGNVVGSTGSVTGAVGSVTGNVGGNVVGSVGSVTGAVGSVTGAVGSVTGNVGGNVVGSTASVAGAVGSVTGNVGGDVAGKVLGGGSGTITADGVRAASVTGAVGSVTGAVGSVTGNVGGSVASVAAGGITAASIATGAVDADALATDAVTEIVTAMLTTAMTEAYSTDGGTATVAQALYLIMQRLTEFSISGTTITVKKLDGSTTAATLTLNDATTPTSSTRAS